MVVLAPPPQLCITPLPENLWTLIALHVAFTFFVSKTPSFQFVSKTFLETELVEDLNDKEIYLKSDRGTQLVNPIPITPVTASHVTLGTDLHVTLRYGPGFNYSNK